MNDSIYRFRLLKRGTWRALQSKQERASKPVQLELPLSFSKRLPTQHNRDVAQS
jgi:hypothetical protein